MDLIQIFVFLNKKTVLSEDGLFSKLSSYLGLHGSKKLGIRLGLTQAFEYHFHLFDG